MIPTGCGLPGIVAGILGATSFITDIPQTIELMNENIELNADFCTNGGKIVAQELLWGESDVSCFNPPLDIVIAASVVYHSDLVPLLLMTLLQLCGENTRIILSLTQKFVDARRLFWDLAAECLVWEKVNNSLCEYDQSETREDFCECGLFEMRVLQGIDVGERISRLVSVYESLKAERKE